MEESLKTRSVKPQWAGYSCIVAAPGPSLTAGVVQACRKARLRDNWRVLLVQDAYRLMKYADALYGCDPHWWRHHKDCDGFAGQKWTTHHKDWTNNKLDPDPELEAPLAELYGLNVVAGKDAPGFSLDPSVIHYGSNSGFQALNLALLFGCKRIVLVGYDMRCVDDRAHFFGNHPGGALRQDTDAEYRAFARHYAAATVPEGVSIVNATPDSALTCYPMVPLEVALLGSGSPPL